jgi:hypothetical protein
VIERLNAESKRKAEEAERKEKKRKLNAIAAKASEPVSKQPSLHQIFAKKDKEAVDSAAAQFFDSNGLSFNVARSPYFENFVSAVAAYGPGYKAPKIDALRTTLLDNVTIVLG